MTPDDTLAAFFADQAPPTRDLAFRSRVAERIARRRAIAAVLALLPWTIAGAVLLWALGPSVAPVVESLSQTLAPAAAILVTTALGVTACLAAGRRLAMA